MMSTNAWIKGTRGHIDKALIEAKPILGGPEGESIMGYTLPTGLWLMLQANVRNLLDDLKTDQEDKGKTRHEFNCALDFALDHAGGEGLEFLRAWREGNLKNDWPEWVKYKAKRDAVG